MRLKSVCGSKCAYRKRGEHAGGVAPVADQFSKSVLPDAGAGLRYKLSKKCHVKLRASVAWGKELPHLEYWSGQSILANQRYLFS